MNSRRLARLMRIIAEIKAHPRREPDGLCADFDISRRQLYKDRDSLAELGLSFHFNRKQGGFELDKELIVPTPGLGLAELHALLAGAKLLARQADFPETMTAIGGLRALITQLPQPLAELFAAALEREVIEDGLGCRPEVLAKLQQALSQGYQAVVVLDDAEESRHTLEPRELVRTERGLALKHQGADGLANPLWLGMVKKASVTPFISVTD